MTAAPTPHRARRDLFRKQAVARFVQRQESGIPDGTWRPIPGLFASALLFAALSILLLVY